VLMCRSSGRPASLALPMLERSMKERSQMPKSQGRMCRSNLRLTARLRVTLVSARGRDDMEGASSFSGGGERGGREGFSSILGGAFVAGVFGVLWW